MFAPPFQNRGETVRLTIGVQEDLREAVIQVTTPRICRVVLTRRPDVGVVVPKIERPTGRAVTR